MSEAFRHIVCPHCLTVNRTPRNGRVGKAKCGECHQRLFIGKPIDVRTEAFDRHIASNDIPVVVDFWAPWCGPCKAMAPGFERAAAELEPDVRLLKVNANDESALAARYGIRSIPTMLKFAHGQIVARNVGLLDAPGIMKWIRTDKHGD